MVNTTTIRPAVLGDKGVCIGWRTPTISGIAELGVLVNDSEIATVFGDWRAIRETAELLAGQQVEVMSCESSEGGCYMLRLVHESSQKEKQ